MKRDDFKLLYDWYNFRTGEYETRDAPSDFHDYIPQNLSAQGLYDAYIEMGDKPSEAAHKTLLAYVGEEP